MLSQIKVHNITEKSFLNMSVILVEGEEAGGREKQNLTFYWTN
jgi:hypothetical protein